MQMRHPFSLSFASATLLVACAGSTPPASAPPAPPPSQASTTAPPASENAQKSLDPRGVALVNALTKGDWAAAEAMFAPPIQNAAPPEKLAQAWGSAAAAMGAFKEVAATRTWKSEGRESLVTSARFEKGFIDVRTSYLEDHPEKTVALTFAPGDAAARAMSVLLPYVKGDAGPLYSHLDDKMKDAISQQALAGAWKSANDGFGQFESLEDSKTQSTAVYDVVAFSAQFAKTRSEIVIVFHKDSDRIADFVLKAVPPPPDPAPPSYAHPDTYEEQPTLVGKGDRALPATLAIPKGEGPKGEGLKGKFPAVVLVHGSGPGDRDETILAQRPFRDIALGLASRGIAVLRYEKRTYGKNVASLDVEHVTIKTEVLDDAIEAVRTLRASPHIDPKRIYVIGHSEGGMLAPLIAEGEPTVAGMVILAGPARPFEDVYLEQVTKAAASQGEAGKREVDALTKQIALVKSADLTLETPSRDLPLGLPPSYWLSLRGYDPVARAAKLARPILVLRGDHDEQVAHVDFTMWQGALGKRRFATLAELPGLSHAFIDAPYDVPHHVSEAAVAKIAEWILARR